ncbi:hypothetical protein O2K51_11125 [Apibacter raozihei]|uniref:hypothetical protein n=1 Tax=Apibacter raozihei TaxID=2500547 RepID=UPI000FE3C0AF|nr:hypothetical protein [Apibacter raozihei]
MSRLILVVSFFIFSFNCSSHNQNYDELVISELNESFEDILSYKKEGNIIFLEIKIIGEIQGDAILELYDVRGKGPYTKIKLNGRVDKIYNTEWYEPNLKIKYKPLSKINGGSLVLRYKMN